MIAHPQPGHNEPVVWSLAACARKHKVTIRQIAAKMHITLKRVREVRDAKTVPSLTAWEFEHEIKGIVEDRRTAVALMGAVKAIGPGPVQDEGQACSVFTPLRRHEGNYSKRCSACGHLEEAHPQ